MRAMLWAGMLAGMTLAAGCGGSDEPEPEKEPMKVEDTVFGDLVTAPGKVQDRTNAALDAHRESLEKRLEEDEGAPPRD